jgi:MoaA/NifB/PqqE/SkfB family radical SAM enzyme
MRWGKNLADDPLFSPYGPEILDIEISSGKDCKGQCAFCYKGNGTGPDTFNMTFDTFKTILDKMPDTLTQIAAGIMNIDTNPDMWKMFAYARSKNIIPNFTMHGLDEITTERVNHISSICGAVAISCYNFDKTADWIKALTDRGMTQVNIHFMISEETYEKALDLIEKRKTDPRLEKMNAIVFLSLKQKGRGEHFSPLSYDKWKILIDKIFESGHSFGFDSCSAHKFTKVLNEMDIPEERKTKIMESVEPCESFGMFSSYINDKGFYFPCSFSENIGEWKDGLDVVNCKDFVEDIWNNPLVEKYREISLKCGRNCPLYDI